MQYAEKTHRIVVFLVLFGIAMSGHMVVSLSHNAFAQFGETLHDRRLSEVVNQSSSSQSSQIDVGDVPWAVGVFEETNTVYVMKIDRDIVSVISQEDNTKIKDIDVGDGPVHIGENQVTNTVYVANIGDDSISVIDGTTNAPVINETTNEPIRIPVGDAPADITISGDTNTLYVANLISHGVSVIDGETNEVVTGVTFYVEPFNSGYIVCDDPATKYTNTNDINDLTTPPSTLAPVGQYIYVSSGTQCMAKPYEGFEFLSWEQNSKDNSTQLLSVSSLASPLDSFVLAVTDFFGDKPDKPEAKLMTEFGTFTANFKEAPAPLPPEFWAQMYAVIATVITALFIPSIIGWFKSKRDAKKLNYFHKQVAALYQDGKLDENDIEALDHLRNRIGDAYSEGNLNEKHYESLRTEISTLYEEIFRKKIDALNSSDGPASKKTTGEQLAQIRNEIKYAFSKGKINEKHYALLNEDISKLDGKEGVNAS